MSDRQKIVDRYLRAAVIGGISTAVLALFYAIKPVVPAERPEVGELILWVVVGLAIVAALIGLIVTFFYMTARRRTDEFTLAMWHAGTTAAFFVGMSWQLIGGIAESFVIRTYRGSDLAGYLQRNDIVDNWMLLVMTVAFFIGFHVKRIRG